MRVGFLSPALLVLLLPTLDALTLSDFQPINGFSSQCTQTYNTPLQSCQQSDFQSGHPCSTNCITFLEALTKMLNTNCKGTSAFPNTLIGLFFSQQGTSTLCPNVLGSSGSGGGGDQASYASAASPGGVSTSAANGGQTSTAAVSATASSAAIFSSSASSSASPSPTSIDSSNPSSAVATSSTVVIADTTVTASNNPSNTPLAAPPPLLASSATSSTSSTSSIAQASSTAKSPGNGGTILDLSSGATTTYALQFGLQSWVLLGSLALGARLI